MRASLIRLNGIRLHRCVRCTGIVDYIYGNWWRCRECHLWQEGR